MVLTRSLITYTSVRGILLTLLSGQRPLVNRIGGDDKLKYRFGI